MKQMYVLIGSVVAIAILGGVYVLQMPQSAPVAQQDAVVDEAVETTSTETTVAPEMVAYSTDSIAFLYPAEWQQFNTNEYAMFANHETVDKNGVQIPVDPNVLYFVSPDASTQGSNYGGITQGQALSFSVRDISPEYSYETELAIAKERQQRGLTTAEGGTFEVVNVQGQDVIVRYDVGFEGAGYSATIVSGEKMYVFSLETGSGEYSQADFDLLKTVVQSVNSK